MAASKGPTVKDASPRLRDDAARIERILSVTEVNSVGEGVLPFGEETRERLRERLTRLFSPAPEPTECRVPALNPGHFSPPRGAEMDGH